MPQLRPYKATDWDAFIRLDLETGAASLPRGDARARALFEEQWPALVKARYDWTDDGPTASASRLWILTAEDGAYAGHLWTTEREDFFSGQMELFVTTIAVDARYRGRGWGRLLMEHAFATARERGLSRVALGVEAINTVAIALYKKLGFQTVRHSMAAPVPTPT